MLAADVQAARKKLQQLKGRLRERENQGPTNGITERARPSDAPSLMASAPPYAHHREPEPHELYPDHAEERKISTTQMWARRDTAGVAPDGGDGRGRRALRPQLVPRPHPSGAWCSGQAC